MCTKQLFVLLTKFYLRYVSYTFSHGHENKTREKWSYLIFMNFTCISAICDSMFHKYFIDAITILLIEYCYQAKLGYYYVWQKQL